MPATETETVVGKLAIGLADVSNDAPVSTLTLKQINICLPDDSVLSAEEARRILADLSVHKMVSGWGVRFRERGIVSSVEMESTGDETSFTVVFRREFAGAVKGFKPFCR